MVLSTPTSRRKCSSLPDDTLCNIAPGIPLCGTVATLCDIDICEFLLTGVSPSLRFYRIDFKVDAHMLSVFFATLTVYPNSRSPSIGVLIGLDDGM